MPNKVTFIGKIRGFFRSVPQNKKVQLIFSFALALGLTSSYWHGLIRLHSKITEKVPIRIGSFKLWVTQSYRFLWNFFSSFTPDIAFLSDVVAFQGAVIAIAYPLSLEIVSRISERYSSNVITRKFSNEWSVRILPSLLIANVIIAVLLKFIYSDSLRQLLLKTLAWLSIIMFFISNILLIIFFKTIRNYAVNSKYLINQLLNDMKKLIKLKSKKKFSVRELSLRQNKLISAFEGTGDVLSYEVGRRRGDKYLVQTLSEMRLVIKEFLDLRKVHPEKFERLLLPAEFYETYKDKQQDAQLLIDLRPEDYFVTFTSAISQFSRIHETAFEAQNLEVGRLALYNFIQLLEEMSEERGNSVFIKQVLNSFAKIRRKAISKADLDSAYIISVSFYTNIVFNSISNKFKLSYLNLFDEYFFRGVQFIISHGATKTYERLIASLVNGNYRRIRELKKPDDYKEVLEESNSEIYARLNAEFKINEKFKSMNTLYRKAITLGDYESFVDQIDSISKIEEIHQLSEESLNLEEYAEAIKVSLAALIKNRNLDGLVIAFGAYCLFKQRYDYIKYMWEFNQPPDSNTFWLNPSIVPLTIEKLFDQYSRRYHFERKTSSYWDDHHGAKVYFDTYFLLLLLRILSNGIQAPEILRQSMDAFQIPIHTDIHFLYDLRNSQEHYINLAGEIRQTPSLIREIGLDINQIDLLFDRFLIPFLRELTNRIEDYFYQIERVKSTSKAKIQEFRADFKEAFSKSIKLRDIFIHYCFYEDRSTGIVSNSQEQIKDSYILDKAVFFEDWYVHTIPMGQNFGSQFARLENEFLMTRLIEWSNQTSIENFSRVLDSLKNHINNIFIVASNSSLNSFIRRRREFKSRWTNQESIPKNTVNSLMGWMTFYDFDIPVYEVYCKPDEKLILILNKENLATVIQRPPQEGTLPMSRVDPESRVDFFYIGIDAFSTDPVLMSSYLESFPRQPEEHQGEANQREYLETQVLLELCESFEFIKNEKFEGYVIKITSEDDDIFPSTQTE